MSGALIEAESISKRFPLPDGKGEFTALRNVNVQVNKGEVLALLGRSGSGKSTLLRIMAGLIPPSDGKIEAGGTQLVGCNPDIAMVFQSFALLPWLTVLENVEVGLEARGVPRGDRTRRAIKAIDMVGLDGFESAYPKELSGGMKQRVGFARAIVMQPKVLFMDEPFSALDVLTAENLRGEIDDLWNAGNFPSESILIVTHNIEEAVLLADRVIVLGSNPGHVRGELLMDMPRPHNRNNKHFEELVEQLYTIMTNPEMDIAAPWKPGAAEEAKPASPFATPLPHARIGGISGLLEILVEEPDGHEEISSLAERLGCSVDDLLTILDGAVLLGFARVADGDVTLTAVGRDFATTTILRSKDLFRQQLLERVPVFTSILKTINEKADKQMRAEFFRDLIDEHFPHDEAGKQFDVIIDWGRYAEIFEYDRDEDVLNLHETGPEG
ncbi:MAG TPA: nitrate/sulfonate/bicarbonate ABC transporter ATP-binding protein [Candidatus Baltobacteraceae bacterium]|nr:nitrate/sulfonate/bicarbonate ABC transporter ATP-binding protein [Candidatus Baltobacteraceae bacterium]